MGRRENRQYIYRSNTICRHSPALHWATQIYCETLISTSVNHFVCFQEHIHTHAHSHATRLWCMFSIPVDGTNLSRPQSADLAEGTESNVRELRERQSNISTRKLYLLHVQVRAQTFQTTSDMLSPFPDRMSASCSTVSRLRFGHTYMFNHITPQNI